MNRSTLTLKIIQRRFTNQANRRSKAIIVNRLQRHHLSTDEQGKKVNEPIPSFQTPPKKDSLVGSIGSFIATNVKEAWAEMTGTAKGSSLKRRVEQAHSYKAPKSSGDEEEEVEEYEGPTSIVLVKDPVSAWEQMKSRLRDSPIIQKILKGSQQVTKVVADTELGQVAQKATQSVKDKIEDAREIWETSQNPIIYTLANTWDSLTSETEEGMTIAQIRKLDPSFIKEEWADEVRTTLVPQLLKAHLEGNLRPIKQWCGEAVYHKLAADIKARKTDGHYFDPNILGIQENRVLLKLVEDVGPIIVVIYMVQQVNCVRNKEGEIIEGSETDIRAKFYSMAFRQEYIEEENVVSWKVIEYMFVGDIPYI